MAFVAPFRIGETVTNAQIVEAFKVGNMGGMRRSKKTCLKSIFTKVKLN